MSAYRRGAPWLDPMLCYGASPEAFDAHIFRAATLMHLPYVGAAKRHWERCYKITAGWLEIYEDLDEDAATLTAILTERTKGV